MNLESGKFLKQNIKLKIVIKKSDSYDTVVRIMFQSYHSIFL